MDPIEDVLNSMHVTTSLYAQVRATAPWGISFSAHPQARLVVITRGSCLLTAESLERPVPLAAGDCLVVQGGVSLTMADEAGREIVDCESVFASAVGRTATYGGPGALTEIVSGRFSFDVSAAEPLLVLLPPLLHIRLDDKHAHIMRSTLQLIALETSEDGFGSSFVIGRLADALFVQAVRAWCLTGGSARAGWLAALKDPRLAAALRAMHADVAHPWTVESLALRAGMSRSGFAAAFKDTVGDTPLGYLTCWRMYRAKTLMRETPLSLQEIAVRVGYDTDTALNKAFKRAVGVAPGTWRKELQPA